MSPCRFCRFYRIEIQFTPIRDIYVNQWTAIKCQKRNELAISVTMLMFEANFIVLTYNEMVLLYSFVPSPGYFNQRSLVSFTLLCRVCVQYTEQNGN